MSWAGILALVGSIALPIAPAAARQAVPAPAAAPGAMPLARALFVSLQNLQTRLAAVTPDRWRAKDAERARFRTDRAAIDRNLVEAIPALALKVEGAPQDVGAAFRLYRDADAVYSVALRAADLASRYAGDDQSQSIATALNQLDRELGALGDFIETAGSAQSAALARLRAQRDAPPPPPPKTLVIDNANAPPPSRHRRAARKSKTKHAKKAAKNPPSRPAHPPIPESPRS